MFREGGLGLRKEASGDVSVSIGRVLVLYSPQNSFGYTASTSTFQ